MPTVTSSGGITITIYEDGTSVIDYPDGSSATVFENGTRIDVSGDGKHWTITDGATGDSVELVWEEGDSGGAESEGGDSGGDESGGDDSGGDDAGSDEELPDETQPEEGGEMPVPDDSDGGDDAGWRPKLWGGSGPRDPMDVSDFGTVIRIAGTTGGPADPWDKGDDVGRRIRFAGGTMAIDPWEKIGPKFRPMFRLQRNRSGLTTYSFNRPALARLLGGVLSMRRGNIK
jgi:hypothetical protein